VDDDKVMFTQGMHCVALLNALQCNALRWATSMKTIKDVIKKLQEAT